MRDLRHHLRQRDGDIFDGDLRSRIGPRRSRPRKKARNVTTVFEKEFDTDPDLAPMIGPFRPTSPECKEHVFERPQFSYVGKVLRIYFFKLRPRHIR